MIAEGQRQAWRRPRNRGDVAAVWPEGRRNGLGMSAPRVRTWADARPVQRKGGRLGAPVLLHLAAKARGPDRPPRSPRHAVRRPRARLDRSAAGPRASTMSSESRSAAPPRARVETGGRYGRNRTPGRATEDR